MGTVHHLETPNTSRGSLIAPFYPSTKAPVTTGNSPVAPSTWFKAHHKGNLDQFSCKPSVYLSKSKESGCFLLKKNPAGTCDERSSHKSCFNSSWTENSDVNPPWWLSVKFLSKVSGFSGLRPNTEPFGLGGCLPQQLKSDLQLLPLTCRSDFQLTFSKPELNLTRLCKCQMSHKPLVLLSISLSVWQFLKAPLQILDGGFLNISAAANQVARLRGNHGVNRKVPMTTSTEWGGKVTPRVTHHSKPNLICEGIQP